ncbi:helicase-related protein [Paenibacillus aurantius]|uniref:Helicase-related protein n=1 Tax=Paenibacillus aurantius TaxID=2918900 RepID=A0AA96RHX9_9BACL|nr:helicase-related protein [Paenibacillus aurantius]WNQ11594.1 helicase-related protein [Paenibacillus aurantius]
MKATVYAVRRSGRWSWNASLDIRVDQRFWFRQGAGTGMIGLEPNLSWGQALWLQKALEEARFQPKDLNEVRREFAARLIQLGLTEKASEALKPVFLSGDRMEKTGFAAFSEEEARAEQALAARLAEPMRGRSLLLEELVRLLADEGKGADGLVSALQLAALEGRVRLAAGVDRIDRRFLWRSTVQFRCRRCGSGEEGMNVSECPYCGGPCPYCERCLTMGRARFCALLVEGAAAERGRAAGTEAAQVREAGAGAASAAGPKGPWAGHPRSTAMPATAAPARAPQGIAYARAGLLPDDETAITGRLWGLSPAQTGAAQAGLAFLRESAARQAAGGAAKPRFLIWAVTGAGKTEMIFPLIEYEVNRGRTVCVATPRRDVVLELLPRIRRAFPDNTVVALYGGSPNKWERGEITLATTHQLMRFRESFDLVVIDELDAFPYHNNDQLQYAALQAAKPAGRYIFLSATPPAALQREIRKGKLPHAKVPVRYHRHPLPVPVLLRLKPLRSFAGGGPLPVKLVQTIQASLDRGAQLFVFVPQIKLVDPLVALLQRSFPQHVVGGTSSKDAERTEKVVDFRQGRIRMLVTTTILERGVTVPKTDVVILDAGSPLFDEAALVQMAGRAGRSKDDPKGRVYYAAAEVTGSQAGAIRQITRMNRIARQECYLLPEEERT